jgi:hypothetical protein
MKEIIAILNFVNASMIDMMRMAKLYNRDVNDLEIK